MYIGVDLNSYVQADNIGIEKQRYVTRSKLGKIFDKISNFTTKYRLMSGSTALRNSQYGADVTTTMDCFNDEYSIDTGINIKI